MKSAADACKVAFEYEEQGQLDRAILALAEAIRLDPDWNEPYFFRGSIYNKKGSIRYVN